MRRTARAAGGIGALLGGAGAFLAVTLAAFLMGRGDANSGGRLDENGGNSGPGTASLASAPGWPGGIVLAAVQDEQEGESAGQPAPIGKGPIAGQAVSRATRPKVERGCPR